MLRPSSSRKMASRRGGAEGGSARSSAWLRSDCEGERVGVRGRGGARPRVRARVWLASEHTFLIVKRREVRHFFPGDAFSAGSTCRHVKDLADLIYHRRLLSQSSHFAHVICSKSVKAGKIQRKFETL